MRLMGTRLNENGRMVVVVKVLAWVKKGLGGVTALRQPWHLVS